MDFNVYTAGGAVQMLSSVFNSLAMLASDGVLAGSFKIALLLAVIGYVIKASLDGGQKVEFQNVAVSVVLFMCFFQVTTRINIEDTTTGEIRAVDNVPFGVGFTASIVSTVSFAFTKKIEQAFSTPEMTKYGPTDPLFTMSSVFDTMRDPLAWSAKNGGYVHEAASTYVKECVAFDVERQSQSYVNLMNSPVNSSLATSPNRVIYINDPSNPNKRIETTCNDAYTKILNGINQNGASIDKAILQSRNQYSTVCSNSPTLGKQPCSSDFAQTTLTNMATFYGNSGKSLREFQYMLMLYPYMMDLPSTINENSYHYYASISKNQSQMQQAFKWSSEGSGFLIWIQYLESFVQALVYGLVPFVAFALAFGKMGIGLTLKYLLVLLWVQTWQPLLAIVNALLLVKTQSDISSIAHSIESFNDLYHMLDVTQKNLALSGHLMASVPVLGAFIVFGSSFAFTGLTGGLSDTGTPDTAPLAPPVSDTKPLHGTAPVTSVQDQSSVSAITGAGQTTPNLTLQKGYQAQQQSALERLSSAQQNYNAAVSKVFGSNSEYIEQGGQKTGAALNIKTGQGTGTSLTTSTTTGFDNTNSQVQSSSTQSGVSLNATATAKASTPGSAGGGSSANVAGSVGGSVTSTATQGRVATTAGAEKEMSQRADGTTSTRDRSSSLGWGTQFDWSKAGKNGASEQQKHEVTDAYQEMLAAKQAYSESVTASQGISSSQTFTSAQVANAALEHGEAVQNIATRNLSNDEFNEARRSYQQQFSSVMSASDAENASIIYAANDTGSMGDDFKTIFGSNIDNSKLNTANAEKNQELAKGTPEEVKKQREDIASTVETGSASVRGRSSTEIETGKSNSSGEGRKLIEGKYNNAADNDNKIHRGNQDGDYYRKDGENAAKNVSPSSTSNSEVASMLLGKVGSFFNNIGQNEEKNILHDANNYQAITGKAIEHSSLGKEQATNISEALANYAAVAKNGGDVDTAGARVTQVYRENGGNASDGQLYSALNNIQRTVRLGESTSALQTASKALVSGNGDQIPVNGNPSRSATTDLDPRAVTNPRFLTEMKN